LTKFWKRAQRSFVIRIVTVTLSSAAAVFVADPAAAAPQITVAESVQVSAEQQKIILSLLRVHLASALGDRSSDGTRGFGVELTIIGLGDGYRIGAKKMVNDKSVFATQAVASSNDELDRTMERLARSLVREKTDPEIDTVTQREEKTIERRKKSSNRFVLGFGPAFPWGVKDTPSLYHLRLGFNWENVQSRLGLQYESIGTLAGSEKTQVSWGSLGILLDWIFTAEEHSPFVGADFSYGSVDVTSRGSASRTTTLDGFSLAARGGYLFFRTSAAQASALCFLRPAWHDVEGKFFGVLGCGMTIEF
jgi:hypothetical protein